MNDLLSIIVSQGVAVGVCAFLLIQQNGVLRELRDAVRELVTLSRK